MLPSIRKVKALPDFSVEIHWKKDGVSVVSFGDVIAKGGLFAQLGDPEFFAQVKVGDHGDCISWPGELDFGADSLCIAPILTNRLRNTRW
jgi:hypothetical protein